MDQWITLRCTSSYPLIHSPYCYGVLPHQTKVTEQPAILPKCFWHTGQKREKRQATRFFKAPAGGRGRGHLSYAFSSMT